MVLFIAAVVSCILLVLVFFWQLQALRRSVRALECLQHHSLSEIDIHRLVYFYNKHHDLVDHTYLSPPTLDE